MLLHKKIRFLRLNKGWSQETMAEKLEMSSNGYGSIERGETNVQLSRVSQIAKLFDISISELFQDANGKNVLNSMGHHNIEIQNSSRCHFSIIEENLSQSECQHGRQQLEFNLEKQIIIIEQQAKEIALLKKLNDLLNVPSSRLVIPYRTLQRKTSVSEEHLGEERRGNSQRLKTNLKNC